MNQLEASWHPVDRPDLRDVLAPGAQIPPGLIPDSFAARLYQMVAPLAQDDPSFDWSLLILVNAIGQPWQLAEEIVRDTPDGPGWSLLLDVDRCPPQSLGWLAQFVGVRLRQDDTDEQSRERIVETDGFRRGTRQAIIAAARATLIGSRNVFVYERTGTPAGPELWGAYRLAVITYTDETPDPAATLAAVLTQKPGGLVLTYQHILGQTYYMVDQRFDSYAEVDAAYANYGEMARDQPPEDVAPLPTATRKRR